MWGSSIKEKLAAAEARCRDLQCRYEVLELRFHESRWLIERLEGIEVDNARRIAHLESVLQAYRKQWNQEVKRKRRLLQSLRDQLKDANQYQEKHE